MWHPGELIDILEMVYAIAAEAGISQFELEEMGQQKRRERGGFEDRIFLIETLAGDVP
jgi:predicted house-cleaning noncanonical NTP pyrophosphatase (MazG superfamily)